MSCGLSVSIYQSLPCQKWLGLASLSLWLFKKRLCFCATYWDELALLHILIDLSLKFFTVCVTESYWSCYRDLQVADAAVN